MNNIYVDTHVHLNDETLKKHLDEVIKDAFLNNVKKMFVVGWDLESSKEALELANKYDWCYAIIGFHPCNIKGYGDEEYAWLEQAAKDNRVVAIGEIGYDLHWDTTTLLEQSIAFEKQIGIAKRIGKPISIHSRDASQLTMDMIKKTNASIVGGVRHSYSGSLEMAKEYIKLNFNFGISGPVTFKNGRNVKEVVEGIDLKYLISETDSPYLTPHPYRGSENGPKYIPLIVKEIANIKNINEKDVMNQILENVKRIFGV